MLNMLELNLPETPKYQFALEESVERGQDSISSTRRLESWVELSEVTSLKLTKDITTEDEDLTNFILSDEKFNFYYVRLGCSFHSSKQEKFDQAWLEIKLASSNHKVSEKPFVWSMRPLDSYETVEVTNSATISPKMTLVSGEISGNIGEQRKQAYKNYFLRAFGEGTPNPFWEFKKTELAEINGSYRFHMIIRAAVGIKVSGNVELFTRVRRKRYLIIPSVEDLSDKPILFFNLS
jgi:hypothetical protein